MKRIVICMDGTWQNLAWQTIDIDPITGGPLDRRTNISKIAQRTKPYDDQGNAQVVFYSPGVGARTFTSQDKKVANYEGATGEGSEENIIAAYMFLSFNYEPGDEIYLFGFSRGAFCVRSLAGLVARCGVLARPHIAQVRNALELYRKDITQTTDAQAANFRREYGAAKVAGVDADADDPMATRITFMGVFETVVMRGGLTKAERDRYKFHNLRIGAHVRAARHALALDETRNALPFRPWTNLDEFCRLRNCNPRDPDALYQQKWFVGAHGDVGGGQSRELSAVSRKWVMRGATAAGLAMTESLRLDGEASDPEFLKGKIEKLNSLWFLGFADRRPYPLPLDDEGNEVRTKGKPDVDLDRLQEHIHTSSILRMLHFSQGRDRYRPNSFRPFRALVESGDAAFQAWLEQRKTELFA